VTEPAKPCYREANGVYFTRGEHRPDCDDDCRGCRPCTADHCTAKRNCTWHLDDGQLACGRCLANVRRDLKWIEPLAALLPVAAMGDGVDSEAANLDGPVPHPSTDVARRVHLRKRLATLGPWAAAAGVDETGFRVMPDEDWHHPRAVLGRWAMMISEDYEHDMPYDASTSWCVAYLDRNLHRIAHDDGQDFPLLGRELRKCRQHLEAVLHNDDRPDRGAPCPECTSEANGLGPRLRREWSHWCEDEACERTHAGDDTDDVWRCPRVREHWWWHHDYENWIEERKASA
jgi:hypothetical protein